MKGQVSVAARLSGMLWLHLGRWLDRKGMTFLSESCYRNGSAAGGKGAAEASFQLTQVLLSNGRDSEAVAVCERALGYHPQHAKLWCALGAARRRLARMDAARTAYENAIALDPQYAQAWSNLGEWWLVKGELNTALDKLEQALALEPGLLEALNNRVAVLYELGRFREAEAAARQAIERHPENAALHANLGSILLHTGNARAAVKAFRTALEYDPACPEAHINLATILGETERYAAALDHIEHEIAIKGESAHRLAKLALALQAIGDRQAVESTCEKVLALQPNNVSALITLAGCHSLRADHHSAIHLYEKALAENPDMASIYSNIAFQTTYLPDLTAEEIFAYHREWSVRFEKTGGQKQYRHDGDKDAGRPLRIGYVSGDFNRHPVGFLLTGIVRSHDRQRFRVHCYSMVRNGDEITDAIREHADVWVDALFMTDDELAERIHHDQIDILLDLSGHTAYNRLPVFVRKPAPVQATWIGYFHSTGLESIDYFITDPFTTPADCNQLFSEIPVWLPHSRFCYLPPEYAPPVTPSPATVQGRITFGSFNRVEKLVEPVIAAWASILKAVPDSRLLLKAGTLQDPLICDGLRSRFAAYGIGAEQLELRGISAHGEMLAQYGEIDIALDPFPFNGGMTTLETLWMGVPVVTMAGNNVVSRQTTSALCNLGLDELIFADVQSYIEGAVGLASNFGRLGTLRQEIRSRMAESPICQPEQFTHDLEQLYRRMWEAHCRGEKLSPELVRAPLIARDAYLHIASRGDASKKIRLVCATRATQERFFKSTALGRSFNLYRQLLPFLELQLFSENSKGLPTIYNQAIDYAETDPAALVFIHDDVFLPDFSWADQLCKGLENFDVVGVAGNKQRRPGQTGWAFLDDKLAWDSPENLSGVVGHGKGFPCDQIDIFGSSGQECKLLDGVFLAAHSTTLIASQLKFDPRFRFHFYDLDFCRQAELKDLRMGTWPISIVHESKGAFSSPSWRDGLDIYLKKYGE